MKSMLACMCIAVCLAACSKEPDVADASATPTAAVPTPSAPGHAEAAVAWHKGDVDAAFAAAKAANLPLFMYWGAVWCPPCNQVKATVFNRRDFIERSRFFVPVYIDGDSPGAQRTGARFKAGGYPTMILFRPDGSEITRLPGEVDADQYMRVLVLGMNGARPVRETLDSALGRGPGAVLAPEDWRMLAYYSWDTDEQQLVAKKDLPATLARLARTCPADQWDTATRLRLRALAAAATAKGAKPRDDPAAVAQIVGVLGDPKRVRANFDIVVYYAGDLAGHVTLPRSYARAELVTAWSEALALLIADAGLSTADRLAAVAAEVDLARLGAGSGALPGSLVTIVRDEAARADRETADPYARQAVIGTAAGLLAEAGLLDESDALLTSELSRSHSPYYFMLDLAANARKRGDKPAAIDWARKAYDAARGPATRLQWGAAYLRMLVELAPQDTARIEAAAASVLGELPATPDTFFERSRRSLEKIGRQLAAWNKDGSHDASLQRIRAQMATVCAKLPAADPARATCDGVLLRPAPALDS